jgi:DNA excision repair protein ERCC-2
VLAKAADVIVADYSYVFDPIIKNVFFTKLEKQIEKCILIVDEGHNLPGRLREALSDSLSQVMLDNSLRELKKYKRHELFGKVEIIRQVFMALGAGLEGERLVKKAEFLEVLEDADSATLLHDELEGFAVGVREERQRSWCGGLARFIGNWLGPEEGFVRYLKIGERGLMLNYRALDPAILSRDVIAASHSTVIMSGTLTPTSMFRDILGFPKDTGLQEYESPFPHENRLAMIVPVTSTRYKTRNPDEYKRIAMVCGALSDEIPGNIAFFFPSYQLRDDVARFLSEYTDKHLLFEERGMTKEAKMQLLDKFVSLRLKGAALLGVVRGSFGEGIDFPGDWLQGVVVVGLPLAKPDLETQAIIDYFNKLNGKGIEYGYIFPAINLALQSAGRCIRSEKDKGVVVLLDERYAFPMYMKYLPKEWHFGVTRNFPELISDFFK